MASEFNFDPKRRPTCECSRPKNPRDIACGTCLDKDGRSAEEYDVTSALRVHGGHAQLASIVEDIGGTINEDKNGPTHRRAYRGLSRLRSQGVITSVAEYPETSGARDPYALQRAKQRAEAEANRKRPRRDTDGPRTPGGGVITYSLRGGR
jgi:hypothetical protein